MRAFRFGLVWQGDGSPAEAARRAEDAGYSTILFPDHARMVAPIPAMAAAATATSRIRVGAQVINVVARPLGMLAQELAAVDLISGGRLEIGLGAGVEPRDQLSVGLPFSPPRERIAQVERALDALPRLFSGEILTQPPSLIGYAVNPLPPQGANMPLMVGGNGDRLLGVAARRAHIVQFLGYSGGTGGRNYGNFTEGGLAGRVSYVKERAGERFAELELSVLAQAAGVVPDPAAAVGEMRVVTSGTATAEEALRSPFVQFGASAGEVRDRLVELRERHGVTYVTVFSRRSPRFDEVIAALNS